MLSDLRHAVRTLLKAPGYTLVAVLTLALGIGATTAIFSIVNSVLLRPLDHPEPSRLVDVRISSSLFLKYPTIPLNGRFFDVWSKCPAFSSLAVAANQTEDLSFAGSGEPKNIRALQVSARFFETLKASALLGRLFRVEDEGRSNNHIVVVSESFWRQHFGADPFAIGKPITLNKESWTIVGVVPAGFHLPRAAVSSDGTTTATDAFLLKNISESERSPLLGDFVYEGIGRLSPGAHLSDAEAQTNAVAAQVVNQAGASFTLRSHITPLQEAVVGSARPSLLLLLGAITAVLLIACINLAVLGLVRTEKAAREYAIRAALGASKFRLVRQSFAESIILSFTGGLVGIAVGVLALRVLLHVAPASLPRISEVSLDSRVLAFSLVLSAVTALLFGLLPAWRCSRNDIEIALRASSRTSTGGPAEGQLRQGLVSLQVAISCILLVASSLLMWSFVRALQAAPGFDLKPVLCSNISVPTATYPNPDDRLHFYTRLLAQIETVAGVSSAATANALPMQGQAHVSAMWTKENPVPQEQRLNANVRFVSPGYFATLGVRLLKGRPFSHSEPSKSVAVISERIASSLWPGVDPIGHHLVHFDDDQVEVIGVVPDLRTDPDAAPVPVIYRPQAVVSPVRSQLAVRVDGEPKAVVAALQSAIRAIDPDIAIPAFQTLEDVRDHSLAERRFQTALASAFGLAALLLAALGLYGVLSYSVARRTRELGIRAAFGAQAGQLRRLVLKQGLVPVLLGLAVGMLGSLFLGKWMSGFLFETKVNDPFVFIAAAAVLIAVGIAACWLPARRATKVDPMVALRSE